MVAVAQPPKKPKNDKESAVLSQFHYKVGIFYATI